jgi:hypothetical protein
VKTPKKPGPWVLVADGSRRPGNQGRAAVAAVRALAFAGYRAAVTVSSGFSLAARSRYCSRRVPVPPVTDEGYVEAIRNELASRPYLACLPASDAVQLALEAPGAELLDKDLLAKRAETAGIPTPTSRSFASTAELRAAADDLHYPVVVKPAVHVYNPFRANSPEGLTRKVIHEGPVVVQPFIEEPIRSVSGVIWKGRLLGTVHSVWLRIWPPDCGSASAAKTVPPDHELEERLPQLLDGYDGIFNAQLIGDYLLDVHPRVYGTHSLALAAGVNQIGINCDLIRGLEPAPVGAKIGAFYRWLEGDLRFVARGIRSGKLSPKKALQLLSPKRGAAHGVESLDDPGPLIARLKYSARRIGMSQEARRADRRALG